MESVGDILKRMIEQGIVGQTLKSVPVDFPKKLEYHNPNIDLQS